VTRSVGKGGYWRKALALCNGREKVVEEVFVVQYADNWIMCG